MNRNGLIKKYTSQLEKITNNLKTAKTGRYALKDATKYLNIEKELQVQLSYEQHENRLEELND